MIQCLVLGSTALGVVNTAESLICSMGVATPACQVGGHSTPPCPDTEARRAKKGSRRGDMMLPQGS